MVLYRPYFCSGMIRMMHTNEFTKDFQDFEEPKQQNNACISLTLEQRALFQLRRKHIASRALLNVCVNRQFWFQSPDLFDVWKWFAAYDLQILSLEQGSNCARTLVYCLSSDPPVLLPSTKSIFYCRDYLVSRRCMAVKLCCYYVGNLEIMPLFQCPSFQSCVNHVSQNVQGSLDQPPTSISVLTLKECLCSLAMHP